MGAIKQFRDERERRIAELKENKEFDETSLNWTKDAFDVQYQYNFDWLGRPIIQIPSFVRFQDAHESSCKTDPT